MEDEDLERTYSTYSFLELSKQTLVSHLAHIKTAEEADDKNTSGNENSLDTNDSGDLSEQTDGDSKGDSSDSINV